MHAHLLPGVDDGCLDVAESLACARRLVEAGYSACVCTPHVWPPLRSGREAMIRSDVTRLQRHLDDADIRLTLVPGAELTFGLNFPALIHRDVITYGLLGRHALFDFWSDVLPHGFARSMRHLQAMNITPVLAHPERTAAFQLDPDLLEHVTSLGVLLQGNLAPLAHPPRAPTRRLGERLLAESRYFMLGSDLHHVATLDERLEGLENARKWVGEAVVTRLTRQNPLSLLCSPADDARSPDGGDA